MIPVFPLETFKDQSRNQAVGTRVPYTEGAAIDILTKKTAVRQTCASTGALARGDIPGAALKISGFGGQGILFLGTLLAEAGRRIRVGREGRLIRPPSEPDRRLSWIIR